jgi:hypothetical protein
MERKSGTRLGFRPIAIVPGRGVAARTLPSLRPKRRGPLGPAQAEKRPSRPADAARRAPQVVTAYGTLAVARSSVFGHGTRCEGTGGVSSSRRRGRRRAQLRGRTLNGWAARRRGGKKKVDAAALLNGEGAPGTLTVPGVALQLQEGNERVRSARI